MQGCFSFPAPSGVSRSASIILAYMMRAQNMDLRAAYSHLKSRRSCAKPNGNFLRQLVEYQKRAVVAVDTKGYCDAPAAF